MTIIGTILAVLFVEGIWRFVIIGALLITDAFEIAVWLRWRKRRSITGPEGLVGTVGRALTDLTPAGQVKLRGQIWKAWADTSITKGSDVEVVAVQDLLLRVTRKREIAAESKG